LVEGRQDIMQHDIQMLILLQGKLTKKREFQFKFTVMAGNKVTLSFMLKNKVFFPVWAIAC
jgi:hypothetical protein